MCTRGVGEYKSRAEYLHRERCRGCIWVHDSTPGYPSRPFEKMALGRWGLRTANQTHKNLQCKLIFSKQLSTTRHTNIANIGIKELQLSILRKNVSQASQAVPNLLGVSIAGYINMGWGGKVTHTIKLRYKRNALKQISCPQFSFFSGWLLFLSSLCLDRLCNAVPDRLAQVAVVDEVMML